MFFSRLFLFLLPAALTVSSVPVYGANIDVGVDVGDWVTYEVIGTVPKIADYEWVKVEVQDVSCTEVTMVATVRYREGGEEI